METKEEKTMEVKRTRVQLDKIDEIDLTELLFVLLHRWKTLLVVSIIGAAIMVGYHSFFVKESFEATTKMYITNKETDLSMQDLQIGSALAEDYKSIIVSQPVLDRVIEELQLDTNYYGLLSMISVTNPTGTHIICTNVRSDDKEKSLTIANTLLNVSIDQISAVVSTGKPSVIEHSRIERVRNVTPSRAKYAIMGGMVGFVIAAAFFSIGLIIDDSIRNDDDVEKYLQLPILAAVPYNEK